MKTAIVSILAFVVITAIGSYYQSVAIPYVVLGVFFAVITLIALGKIQPKEYPIYVYGLSLALLWQTSMLGVHIVGRDIHGEFYLANQVVVNGWDLNLYDPHNSSIVFGLFTPFFAKMGIPVVWQFKALYPAVFASVPLILYFAFKRMISERLAFWATLFFMITPVWILEITGIVKSMVAEVFLALIVLFFTLNWKAWQKALGVGLAIILASLCHYTVGIVVLIYFVGIFFVLLIGKGCRVNFLQVSRMTFAYLGAIIVITSAFTVLWFGNVSSGYILKSYEVVVQSWGRAIMGYSEAINNTDLPTVVIINGEGVKDAPISSQSTVYLHKQEVLAQTAIGLDFNDASIWGKIFRVLQYMVEALCIAGLIYLFFRHKRYKLKPEFSALVIMSFVIMGLCVFLPGFSSLINLTRFYQIATFFFAPVLIIGFVEYSSDFNRGIKWINESIIK